MSRDAGAGYAETSVVEHDLQISAASSTNPYKVAAPLAPAGTKVRGSTQPPFSIGLPTENREFAQFGERMVDARPAGKTGRR
jgi:hypothetical protein